jgi:hypothetical protein
VTSLQCHFGLLAPNATVPDWLSNQLGRISEIFSAASNDDIELSAGRIVTIPRVGFGGVTAVELQRALDSLTHNSSARGSPSNIGVIFADSFAPRPETFGLMFDPGTGFAGLPDPNRIPREGCAVFLRAIESRRGSTARQESGPFADPIEAETFFTTMHELGHVFNLWHSDSADNYIWSSAKQNFAPQSDAGFAKPYREFLAQCSNFPSFVRPGGGPFGHRGSLGPTDVDLENAPAGWKAAKIRIRLSDEEFFCFQPVELEIDVTIDKHQRRKVAFPDVIDPGYEAFDIFLEEPDGQRRTLRSSRHYCPDGKVQILTPDSSFHRDISVFGDADGFFFRRPGAHKIWARIRFNREHVLVSNVLDFLVLERADAPRAFSAWAPVLSRPEVARLLYHRFAAARSRAVQLVEAAAPRFARSNGKLAKEMHYVLGRVFETHARRSPKGRRGKELRQTARRHFDKAMAGDQLSAHRRRVVERILEHQMEKEPEIMAIC